MVKKILSIRDELEVHKTRRTVFSGIGPEVIQRMILSANSLVRSRMSGFLFIIHHSAFVIDFDPAGVLGCDLGQP